MDLAYNFISKMDSRTMYVLIGLAILLILISIVKSLFKIAVICLLLAGAGMYMNNFIQYTEKINLTFERTNMSFYIDGQAYNIDLRKFEKAEVDEGGTMSVYLKDGTVVDVPIKNKNAHYVVHLIQKYYDENKGRLEKVLDEKFEDESKKQLNESN